MRYKIFLVLVLLLVYFRWFIPGPHVATDLHFTSLSQRASQLSLPSTWDSSSQGLGGYGVGLLWNWPEQLIFASLSHIGIPENLSVAIIGVGGTLGFALLGITLIGRHEKFSDSAQTAASILYLANTYILLLIDGGQLNLALAYGLLPVCFGFYLLTAADYSKRNCALLALSLIALSIVDIRIVYLFAILAGSHFLFHWDKAFQGVKKFIVITVVSLVILLGFHAYWLVPAVFSRPPVLPNGYASVSQIATLSFATLGHALSLFQPHWYLNIYGHVVPVGFMGLILPIAIFTCLALTKLKPIKYWLSLLLIMVFLGKGDNPPLGQIYTWVFTYVPGMSVFRDPTKFFFLIALSYAIILGYGFDRISERFKNKKINLILLSILAGYFLVLTIPVWSGKMTGTFSTPRFVSEYTHAANYLSKDNSFGRVLWVPQTPPLGYASPLHQSLEGLQIANLRPFATGINGTYETMNFLRDASYSGQLLQLAGVKYVALNPLDPMRDSQKPEDLAYHQFFLAQLQNTNWADKYINFGTVSLIKTKNIPKLFFMTSQTDFVVGSDDIYQNLSDLAATGLIFTEEYPQSLKLINNMPEANLVLRNKSKVDVAADLLSENSFINPAKFLQQAPDKLGWWSRRTTDFLWLRNFLQQKYQIDNQDFDFQQGWSIAEGSHKLIVNLPVFDGKKLLLARTLYSTRSGELTFNQLGQDVGSIKTYMPKSRANYVWKVVGSVLDKPVSIQSSGDINIINTLAIVTADKWANLQSQADQLLQRQPTKHETAQISYRQISTAHYKISIRQLSQPQLLIFSQSYDSLWKLNTVSPMRVYSFLNGFRVTQDGDYDLFFEPQKFVFPGLIISAISLIVIVVLLKI